MNQKRIGILLSYLNLILGMVVNLFMTPLLIKSLGDVDYSLYKVMQSFAGPLAMFHLGISTIVTRSIVQFSTDESYTKREKQNTMALALLASGIMAALVSAAGIAMCTAIPGLYGETYSAESVALGQQIFLVFMASTIFHMMTDAFSGCMVGHEKFAVTSGVQLVRTLVKMLLWFVLLKVGMGVLAVTLVDLGISLGTFLFSVGYTVFFLRETPRLYYFDGKKLWEIVVFGAAILLQAIVNQVNNNVDNIILGAVVDDPSIITMYSSALAIYAIYNSLIAVIANFFLPKATRLIQKNATGEELTDFVIGPGRFQAILAVACILGFALFGRNFITIWIGDKYMDAYWVTLMLMIPVTIPLVENTMISVLDASLKRIYRSVALVIMSVLNVIVSLLLVSRLGFWGAAIGTVASLIIGHGIMMNVYYAKTFKLQVGRMFLSIFKGILPAGLAAGLLCLPLVLFLADTLVHFLVKCACFLLFYGVFLLLFGLNASEKDTILKMLRIRRGS
jgi:O-antigen/teichoic acid export membrane protein